MRKVLLDESDPLWPTLRHLHISDAIMLVLDEFNAFVKENKVFLSPFPLALRLSPAGFTASDDVALCDSSTVCC